MESNYKLSHNQYTTKFIFFKIIYHILLLTDGSTCSKKPLYMLHTILEYALIYPR